MTTNAIQKKRQDSTKKCVKTDNIANRNLPTVNEFMDLLTRDQPLATSTSVGPGYTVYTKYSRGS
jgi:hypothetical protein